MNWKSCSARKRIAKRQKWRGNLMVVAVYHSAVKRINLLTSAALFCKSNSFQNFLKPFNQTFKFIFSSLYSRKQSSLHLLTNISAIFMPLDKWSRQICHDLEPNYLEDMKASKAHELSRHVPFPMQKSKCYCIFCDGSSVFPIISCSKQSCRSPQ